MICLIFISAQGSHFIPFLKHLTHLCCKISNFFIPRSIKQLYEISFPSECKSFNYWNLNFKDRKHWSWIGINLGLLKGLPQIFSIYILIWMWSSAGQGEHLLTNQTVGEFSTFSKNSPLLLIFYYRLPSHGRYYKEYLLRRFCDIGRPFCTPTPASLKLPSTKSYTHSSEVLLIPITDESVSRKMLQGAV